jgi:hypothetical protein
MNINSAINFIYLPRFTWVHPTKWVHSFFQLGGKPHAIYTKDILRKLNALWAQKDKLSPEQVCAGTA